MTAGRSIDYEALTQDAARWVVRTILTQVAKSGLPGDHHFYIAFDTQAPGVVLSRRLRDKYPEEMMIVLQHRFWDLAVTEEYFEVKLTFDGIPERLVIPFQAIRVFFDPSVRFTFQFGDHVNADEDAGPRRRRRDSIDGDADAAHRRARRPKARTDKSADDDSAEVSEPTPSATQPTVFAPRAVETKPAQKPVSLPSAQPGPAAASAKPAESQDAAPQPGGAKVLSLDQFRKK